MEIHETPLPGVGIRYDFSTRDGRQMGVVNHHTGRHELVIYDRDDPDACREVINFSEEEAETIASLFGSTRITGPLNDLQQRIEGLTIDWIEIRGGTPFVNRPMGDTQARTLTKCSIVAVVRRDVAHPSPGPDFVFEANDIVVAAGTPNGIKMLTDILNGQ